jgi:hypothetical protein
MITLMGKEMGRSSLLSFRIFSAVSEQKGFIMDFSYGSNGTNGNRFELLMEADEGIAQKRKTSPKSGVIDAT